MNRKANLLVVFTALLLLSCVEKESIDDSIEVIDFHTYKEVENIDDLGKFYKNKKEIVLNNKGEVGEAYSINKVSIYEDRIYVLDNFIGIAIYSINGDFIKPLTAKGNGPGEYVYTFDFSVDKKGYIHLLDMIRGIIVFDNNGKYVKTFPIPAIYNMIHDVGDGRYIMGVSNAYASYQDAPIHIINPSDTSYVTKKLGHYHTQKELGEHYEGSSGRKVMYEPASIFNTKEGIIYYRHTGFHDILMLNNDLDTLKCIRFDFGKNNITEEQKELIYSGKRYDKNKYMSLARKPYTYNEYIFGTITGYNGKSHTSIVANKDKKLFFVLGKAIVGADDNKIILQKGKDENIALEIYEL